MRYWARISKVYHDHKKNSQERTISSLQHRWGLIQHEVSKFCSYFGAIERRHQSGQSEDDKMRDALRMHDSLAGNQFPFMHCWLILRHEPKWDQYMATLTTAGGTEAREEQAAMPEPAQRPMGRDRAKKQRSESSSSSSSACLEVLQKMHMDRSAYEERLERATKEEAEHMSLRSERKIQALERSVQLQEKKLELQMKQEDNKLMMLDVDKMAPWVRDYFIECQKEVAAAKKRSADGGAGPSSS